ncbi:hypothetical protein M7I_0030 [Glarea lozoyensis 74030]|uniref:Uncharacterized protein n=1 Tax=Glarea lozoyensis (strain ATCC 74030 / MF5533) TaxID=1104152 RepID=H0EC97_GLAL7|nr:hypothetical protein M7I_0030 [Glarea lozoyensis 74030]
MSSSFREDLLNTPDDFNGPQSFQKVPGHDDNDIDDENITYHNAIAFLGTWAALKRTGGTSSSISERPPVPAMMYDNTTVTGSWVQTDYSNITVAYSKFGRVVNNVTLSMPHAGVFAAARHEDNEILQPDELGGTGQYVMRASVVSPSVNVLCANAMESELEPIIWAAFPSSNMTNSTKLAYNVTPPVDWKDRARWAVDKPFGNATALDDVFEWGEKYGRQKPIFPMYPAEYNSITNASWGSYGRDAYLLIKAPEKTTSNYTLFN